MTRGSGGNSSTGCGYHHATWAADDRLDDGVAHPQAAADPIQFRVPGCPIRLDEHTGSKPAPGPDRNRRVPAQRSRGCGGQDQERKRVEEIPVPHGLQHVGCERAHIGHWLAGFEPEHRARVGIGSPRLFTRGGVSLPAGPRLRTDTRRPNSAVMRGAKSSSVSPQRRAVREPDPSRRRRLARLGLGRVVRAAAAERVQPLRGRDALALLVVHRPPAIPWHAHAADLDLGQALAAHALHRVAPQLRDRPDLHDEDGTFELRSRTT